MPREDGRPSAEEMLDRVLPTALMLVNERGLSIASPDRRRFRMTPVEPDEETGTTLDVADATLNAEQQILRRERLAAIKKHVLALPEKQRAAVLMHKYEGMDYREIAAVLKLSESATKSLLFRAYETLRERLKEFV